MLTQRLKPIECKFRKISAAPMMEQYWTLFCYFFFIVWRRPSFFFFSKRYTYSVTHVFLLFLRDFYLPGNHVNPASSIAKTPILYMIWGRKSNDKLSHHYILCQCDILSQALEAWGLRLWISFAITFWRMEREFRHSAITFLKTDPRSMLFTGRLHVP